MVVNGEGKQAPKQVRHVKGATAEPEFVKLIHTCSNHYFIHEGGENIRRKALEKGIFEDFSVKLGLIYGASFGFKVLHRPELYTRFGQVKDDVERTLRYWHRDSVCLRFTRYAIAKQHIF